MKAAVVVFPGTWSDGDCSWALQKIGIDVRKIWHRESSFEKNELIVLPGGFSYGDYLRCGSIAQFSPVMQGVRSHAENGGLVIGICNGFQILCESGLLPGALIRNQSLQFRCEDTYLVPGSNSPFTKNIGTGQVLQIPISHGEGNYYADKQTLDLLEDQDRVAFRYSSVMGEVNKSSNPNGSSRNIAGIVNEKGNVLGMMPHPERACEGLLGSEDGNQIWLSILEEYL
ncbi:MAG: phosphoribosylformylglycinamidine synthase I [Chloroflexi bacterium]|nr:phosphoribosylformylglycinamidine synthase I [Chloroflexota bacterium]|tara:strand:- start:8302 stop:8985 length:684 start_codon:yes stop_codon:yes gene_type:complete